MAIQLKSPPIIYTAIEGEWVFVFDSQTNILQSSPSPGPVTTHTNNKTVGVGSTEQECWQYIETHNIKDTYDDLF